MKRRTILRGLGATLALPVLECMSITPPKRMLIIANNLGLLPKLFFPTTTGRNYQPSTYLEHLSDHRHDFTVFSGLSHPGVTGGHSTDNCFLTAARGAFKAGFRNTISLDQFAAEKLGPVTRFATLSLGVNVETANRSLSWTRDGVLLPAEESAPLLFQKMFVQGDPAAVAQQLHRLEERGSILDTLLDESKRFGGHLGGQDKARLDQYFTSIRELERQLHDAEAWEYKPKPVVKTEADAKPEKKQLAEEGAPGPPIDSERPLRNLLKLTVGPLSFLPVVLIQAQVLPYVGDDALAQQGDAADSEGFRLRRGRLGLELQLLDQGRSRVSVELGSREDGAARIHDAWLAYVGLPFFQVWGGAMTVPFSRSAIAGSGDQSLTERPLSVRVMTPGQQVGVVVRGEVAERALIYDAGVFNGFSRTDQFFGGYAQNYAPFGNRFEGLAYVARLATEPIGALTPTIADETHQKPAFGVGANYHYSDGSARGIHAVGGDALLHVYGFHLLAEALFMDVVPKSDPEEPANAVAEIESLGIVTEVGYSILKDLLGVTLRFEYIDSAMGADDEGDNWLLGGGPTMMFFDGMVRGTAEFQHREEINGVSLSNDGLVFQVQLVAP